MQKTYMAALGDTEPMDLIDLTKLSFTQFLCQFYLRTHEGRGLLSNAPSKNSELAF
jgi:hypothetical protein